jgi:hypothetical protein
VLTLPFLSSANNLYLVLGKSILKNLTEMMPGIGKRFVCLEHPILDFSSSERSMRLPKSEINFGILGSPADWKHGADRFVEIGRKACKQLGKEKAIFSYIGSGISKGQYERCLELGNFNIPSPWEKLPFIDYHNYIEKIDYVISLANQESYHLRASGTFFDALAHFKPIIALENPFISYYFRKYGDLGYLCKDLNELQRVIIEISKDFPSERYLSQQHAIKNLITENTLVKQSERLRNLIASVR